MTKRSNTARRKPKRSLASILATTAADRLSAWLAEENEGERRRLLADALTSIEARLHHIEARLP